MRHLFMLYLLFAVCSLSGNAQDVIVKKDGSTVVCRIVELTTTEAVYQKWNASNNYNYVMNLSRHQNHQLSRRPALDFRRQDVQQQPYAAKQ